MKQRRPLKRCVGGYLCDSLLQRFVMSRPVFCPCLCLNLSPCLFLSVCLSLVQSVLLLLLLSHVCIYKCLTVLTTADASIPATSFVSFTCHYNQKYTSPYVYHVSCTCLACCFVQLSLTACIHGLPDSTGSICYALVTTHCSVQPGLDSSLPQLAVNMLTALRTHRHSQPPCHTTSPLPIATLCPPHCLHSAFVLEEFR